MEQKIDTKHGKANADFGTGTRRKRKGGQKGKILLPFVWLYRKAIQAQKWATGKAGGKAPKLKRNGKAKSNEPALSERRRQPPAPTGATGELKSSTLFQFCI